MDKDFLGKDGKIRNEEKILEAVQIKKGILPLAEERCGSLFCYTFDLKPAEYLVATTENRYLEYRKLTVFTLQTPGYLIEAAQTLFL